MRRILFCRKTNIFDNVVYMMEKYADNLEELVMERTGQLIEEKKKTDALLERMLPRFGMFGLSSNLPVLIKRLYLCSSKDSTVGLLCMAVFLMACVHFHQFLQCTMSSDFPTALICV